MIEATDPHNQQSLAEQIEFPWYMKLISTTYVAGAYYCMVNQSFRHIFDETDKWSTGAWVIRGVGLLLAMTDVWDEYKNYEGIRTALFQQSTNTTTASRATVTGCCYWQPSFGFITYAVSTLGKHFIEKFFFLTSFQAEIYNAISGENVEYYYLSLTTPSFLLLAILYYAFIVGPFKYCSDILSACGVPPRVVEASQQQHARVIVSKSLAIWHMIAKVDFFLEYAMAWPLLISEFCDTHIWVEWLSSISAAHPAVFAVTATVVTVLAALAMTSLWIFNAAVEGKVAKQYSYPLVGETYHYQKPFASYPKLRNLISYTFFPMSSGSFSALTAFAILKHIRIHHEVEADIIKVSIVTLALLPALFDYSCRVISAYQGICDNPRLIVWPWLKNKAEQIKTTAHNRCCSLWYHQLPEPRDGHEPLELENGREEDRRHARHGKPAA